MQLKKRYFEDNKDKKEQEYFKSSATESSFNSITKSIFDSSLYGSYAFIESICDKIPKKMINNKIFYSLIHDLLTFKFIKHKKYLNLSKEL